MNIGSNDNPTANEFKRLYRKLLVCHEVVYDGKKANCITDETGILTVSSELVSESANSAKSRQPRQTAPVDLDELDYLYHEIIDEELEKFDEHLNAYAASKVEEKIKHAIRTQKNKCNQCLQTFHQNEMISNSFIARKASTNEQIQPCKDTVKIIKVINKIHSSLSDQEYDVETVRVTVLQYLDYEDLFNGTDFEDHNNVEMETTRNSQISHKEDFIRSIVEGYTNIKAHNIFRKISDEERGVYIRHHNRKQTHFAGQ